MSLEEAGTLQQPLTLIILYISIFFHNFFFFVGFFFIILSPFSSFPCRTFVTTEMSRREVNGKLLLQGPR